jgi:hypothetical protein
MRGPGCDVLFIISSKSNAWPGRTIDLPTGTERTMTGGHLNICHASARFRMLTWS